MFDSIVSYSIVFEYECGKCLREKVKDIDNLYQGKKEVHHVMSKSSCEVLSSFSSDLIGRKIDFDECLHE
jgi:hypothetical protein